jgi:hypothetical protein
MSMPESTELLELLTRLANADLAADLAGEFRPHEIVDRTLHRVVGLVPGAEQAALLLRAGPVDRISTGALATACIESCVDGARPPGVGSLLACPLPYATGDRGTLLLCARDAGAFGHAAEQILPNVANRMCVALAHAEKLDQLRQAIQTRQVIGQACGILMERHKVRADRAFEMLVRASQCNHLKIRELASRLVETGQEPSDIRW